MAELYTNLNSVTLYKTPKFNVIDSVMFASKNDRDTYFNTFTGTDKIEITEFTDLYEGRAIVLPYNYLDLKEYNTMKMYYNDGLGHEETYYCNVDNYAYISTDACFPIYRIDYFLTFSYLLYNKTIPMITDRRTVAENSLTKNMKADSETIPRLKYEKHTTYTLGINETPKTPYYVVYLNKTTGGVGKKGINCKMEINLGKDSLNNTYLYEIDTYTVGCYVAIADKDHLNNIIGTEPAEYIEKIIEVDTPMSYLHNTDFTNLESNGYVYLTQDIDWTNSGTGGLYYGKVKFYNEGIGNDDIAGFPRAERINLYPNHKKKILEWQPTTGIVIQGNEFDIKDFDDRDFPSVSGVTTYKQHYSTIYFFNFLGYTFAYPLGYRHENINMDYMIKWQSGRNFTYSSDYTNSLAYKELQEYNTQTAKYAKQQAGVQSYYNNQLMQKGLEALDITKNQTVLSYQNEFNTLNTNISNLREQYYSTSARLNTAITSVNPFSMIKNLLQGNDVTALSNIISYEIANNNVNLYNTQKAILNRQGFEDYRNIVNQKDQLILNTRYQNDCLAIARDNTIANIAISNKYNNAKPNAYYETDFTQFSSYYYTFYIDLTDGDAIEQNIKNRYNVLGTYVGYLENWQPSNYEGLYFDYIKGSIINNSMEISKDIPNDVYIELVSRIEEGVRIWHPNQLAWFGNLLIDNTNLGTAEPYNNYTDTQKADLLTDFNQLAYNDLEDKAFIINYLTSYYSGTISASYISWFVNNMPWGPTTIPATRQSKILFYITNLSLVYSTAEAKDIVKNADFLTVYEKQWALPQIT